MKTFIAAIALLMISNISLANPALGEKSINCCPTCPSDVPASCNYAARGDKKDSATSKQPSSKRGKAKATKS
ncbi:MAG TPA: hypothetical protein VNJ08_00360 [Bacteriovoracaceae bacterium]|nr:hypothetical protein [Bacteriovoracaceae bacterium]